MAEPLCGSNKLLQGTSAVSDYLDHAGHAATMHMAGCSLVLCPYEVLYL